MPRTWTEEEKEAQRQRMLQLHAEGRAGGQFGKLGGRPKTPRASEIAAERVRKEAEEIADRLFDITYHGRNGESLKAIDMLYALEEQERKIDVDEEKRIDELNRTETLAVVRAQFAELLRRGDIELDRRTIVGESELIIDGGIAEIGEGQSIDS